MISLERKTLHHVQVLNATRDKTAWQYQCIYCQKVLDQIMSVHSHVLSQHPEMYKKVKVRTVWFIWQSEIIAMVLSSA